MSVRGSLSPPCQFAICDSLGFSRAKRQARQIFPYCRVCSTRKSQKDCPSDPANTEATELTRIFFQAVSKDRGPYREQRKSRAGRQKGGLRPCSASPVRCDLNPRTHLKVLARYYIRSYNSKCGNNSGLTAVYGSARMKVVYIEVRRPTAMSTAAHAKASSHEGQRSRAKHMNECSRSLLLCSPFFRYLSIMFAAPLQGCVPTFTRPVLRLNASFDNNVTLLEPAHHIGHASPN